jgi:hypothetical protein
MKDDDVKAQLKAINERMIKLEEAFLDVARPYAEVMEQMQSFQEISKGYFKLMGLYQKHGQISPEMAVPGLKDPISKDLLQIVIEKGVQAHRAREAPGDGEDGRGRGGG